MKVCGIVCEYNPFHDGHRYHIEKNVEGGATHIVAVMSGNVVQRGDIAVFDKHFRARKACENGANLVLELPCPYSCASSENFALGAVGILKGLGVVNRLSFGCETNDVRLLKKAAECTLKLSDSEKVRSYVSKGLSYPAAMSRACGEIFGEDVEKALLLPNNTLALEYIKAAKRLGWEAEFFGVERKGAAHDSKEVTDGFASASFIRERILGGNDSPELLSYDTDGEEYFDLNVLVKAAALKFKSMTEEEICSIPDCTKELGYRIFEYLSSDMPLTMSDFYDSIKTKNITHARIRRVILYGLLGIKSSDFKIAPYARVLAADDKGMEILAASKPLRTVEVSTSLAKLSKRDEGALRLAQLDELSSYLQKLCSKSAKSYRSEFSVKFSKV